MEAFSTRGIPLQLEGQPRGHQFQAASPRGQVIQALAGSVKIVRRTSRADPLAASGTFKKDLPRLTRFLHALNRRTRHAIEFRDPSWMEDEVFKILRRHGVANVALSSQKMPRCLEPTTDFVYVRFHGLEGGSAHDYTDWELQPWAKFLRGCGNRGLTGFVYTLVHDLLLIAFVSQRALDRNGISEL